MREEDESGTHRTDGYKKRPSRGRKGWVDPGNGVAAIPDPFPGADKDRPWTDESLLRHLYEDLLLSKNQISVGWDCSATTVTDWMGRHGIEQRSKSEQHQIAKGTYKKTSYRVNNWGHVVCGSGQDELLVHRLLAAAEWGPKALEGLHVHHKNEIPWDNRIENLELVTNKEHGSKHKKIEGLDRLRIAELYENGDISYRELHKVLDYDVSWATIMGIHHEFYGAESERAVVS